MANARQFAIDLDREFEDLTDEQITLVTQKIAMEALQRVVLKSPVDTGRFKGNWTVSLNIPDLTVTPNTDKNGAETINRGSAVIESMPEPQITYLTNNLPYANRLENGWSKQAPQGMVAVTVAELETMFARVE